MILQALAVRSALKSSGLDHGPISVHGKMCSMGLEAPSPAPLARIFHHKGVYPQRALQAPRLGLAPVRLPGPERLRAAGHDRVRFSQRTQGCRLPALGRPLPPGCRLLGRAPGETSDAAIAVFDKSVTAHSVPQRLLTDNGTALNPSRQGHTGRLAEHVRALWVDPLTGKQALQTHHPGQEQTPRPAPVPLPRQAALS